MHVKTLEVGYLMTNCYVVADEESRECAVLDPGGDPYAIADYLEEHRLKCRAVLLTHGHFDQVMGVEGLMEFVDGPLYMSRLDLDKDIGNGSFLFSPPENTVFVGHGDTVEVGKLRFEVIGCPGHTPGGLAYRIEDCLFTGDTLFRLSVGRSDFPASDEKALRRSLARLAALEGDYDVYPGHGRATTLEYERRFNPYL